MQYSPAYSPATPGYDMSADGDTSSVYSPSYPLSPINVPETENSADRPDSPAPPESKVVKLDNDSAGDFSPCVSIPSSFEHDVYTPGADHAASTVDYNPYGTPGPGMLSGAMITTPKLDDHWAVPGLLVNIKRSPNSFTHGVCRGIPTAGVVKVETENGMISCPMDCITPVAPQFRDRVAIIRGDLVGVRGFLLAIDQNEGIVSINDVPQMVPMIHLCQVYQEPKDDEESVMSASPTPQLNK
ncbi:hypothetical protein B566_EDAN008264 [Ephemera danica]|nr:hypothetical protein B566_EDAN008264 [Ephemera danica]